MQRLLKRVRELNRIRAVILAVLICFSVYLLAQTVRMEYYIRIGEGLAAQTVPFSRSVPDATFRILVVGDSTAVGTGATTSTSSVAGLLGQRYPKAEITNLGVNGSKMRDIVRQMDQVTGVYDLVIVQGGGNDTVRFTQPDELMRDTLHVLALASIHGKHVLFGSTSNVGSSQLFPLPTRWIFERQTRKNRILFLKAVSATKGDIRYIDLFREHEEDPFRIQADAYYAPDWFHPSDAAYAHWFRLIAQELDRSSL